MIVLDFLILKFMFVFLYFVIFLEVGGENFEKVQISFRDMERVFFYVRVGVRRMFYFIV